MGGNSAAAFSVGGGGYMGAGGGGIGTAPTTVVSGGGGAVGGGGVAAEIGDPSLAENSMLGSTAASMVFPANNRILVGSGTSGGIRSWEMFSDRYAQVSAADFAKACVHFINHKLSPDEARQLSYRHFSQRFTDTFAEHYEREFLRRRNNLKVFYQFCQFVILID